MRQLDAERAAIGAVLQDPARLAELHDLAPHHFQSADLATLWGVVRTMRQAIDLVTVSEAALSAGVPVSSVLECKCPAAANAAHYAGIVIEGWRRREFRRILEVVAPKIETTSVSGVVWDLTRQLDAVCASSGSGSVGYGDTWDRWFDEVTAPESESSGLSWGLYALDEKLGPIRRGKLIVIAARPGMGKSALAQQISEAIAAQGVPVAFGQTEMSAHDMLTRSVSRHTEIPAWRFVRNKLRDRDLAPIDEARRVVQALPMYVVDRPGLTVEAIRAEAIRRGAGVVVVDYLQRMSSPEQSEYERVSALSAGLKDMTRDGGPTVIALAQLSRQVEQRPISDRMPIASDLRSSGQIEQDADIILGILRPAVYDDTEPADLMRVGVIKHREGVPGEVIELSWDGPTMTTSDARSVIAL